MSVEEYIKQKTDEMMNKFKDDCVKRGFIMTEENERYMRAGMSYGITLSSMALSQLPCDVTMDKITKKLYLKETKYKLRDR